MPSLKSIISSAKNNDSNGSLMDSGNNSQSFSDLQSHSSPPDPFDAEKPHFFTLPLNVRKDIYRHATVTGTVFVRPFVSLHYINESSQIENHVSPNMALFRTCKKIYDEAVTMFYQENTFSIVHPDILLHIIEEYPRVGGHLKYMRNVEVILNCRDFQHLSGAFCDELLRGGVILNRDQQEIKQPGRSAKKLLGRRAGMLCARQYKVGNGGVVRCKGAVVKHDNDIKGMHDHLYGRTLTFIRQRLLISKLFLNFAECSCAEGCCRLVDQVMNWGWHRSWVFGLPRNIFVTGATQEEHKKLLDTIAHQRPGKTFLDNQADSTQNHRESFTHRTVRGMLSAIDLKS